MANKGNNRHLKRLATSKFMHIRKKVSTFVTKPNPGRFNLEESIALITLLKEHLNLAKTSKEARIAIKKGAIKVNGKTIKDEAFPIGFNDIISIVPNDKYYKININKGKLVVEEIKKEEAEKPRILKVVKKYKTKGNKIMLQLMDGSNISGNNEVKVGDSIAISNNKIDRIIKLEKGANCFVFKGRHTGKKGTIVDIIPGNIREEKKVVIKAGDEQFETPVSYVIVM